METFLHEHNLLGLTIGALTFIIIGVCHPLVIKGEYYFGTRCWWVFMLAGIASLAGCLLVADVVWSSLLGVWAFSMFWSIGELFEQKKRVERGWFPRRPSRPSGKN